MASTGARGPRAVGSSSRRVGFHENNPIARAGQPATRLFQHGPRDVECEHATLGQPLQQQLGHTPGAAPAVENRFVARKCQPVDNRCAPCGLGVGDPVVVGGIPILRGRGRRQVVRGDAHTTTPLPAGRSAGDPRRRPGARRVNIEIGSPNCRSSTAASEKPKRTQLYNAVQSCTVIGHVHQHDRQ